MVIKIDLCDVPATLPLSIPGNFYVLVGVANGIKNIVIKDTKWVKELRQLTV